MKNLLFGILLLLSVTLCGQISVPEVYSNISIDEDGSVNFNFRGKQYPAMDFTVLYTRNNFTQGISGNEEGLSFDLNLPSFNGVMYYGFIHTNDSKHPLPVYFKTAASIDSGKCFVSIKSMSGPYDMIGWQKTGKGILGYRILDHEGNFIYDGKVAFNGTGPFQVANTIIEGPFIDLVDHQSATISFETNISEKIAIEVNGETYSDKKKSTHHEIKITELKPSEKYEYILNVGGVEQKFNFQTAPEPGSRKPFCFAYASDSRSGMGGGERDVFGVNAYIMKKIMALSVKQGASFFQFTGDLIDGYLTSVEQTKLQYSNWKRAVEPWASSLPIYEGFGNHELISMYFPIPDLNYEVEIPRFPFETQSPEVVFASEFVNPSSTLVSEDGSLYDPNPSKSNFPTYKENVYYYTYDNVAVVCLNSNYFNAYSLKNIKQSSGNLHGYIMDNQLKWLEETLIILEKDTYIDHIFVTVHTPVFPNGGHVESDMWYNGENGHRAVVSGKPVAKGIIERRDEFLDLVVNKSEKVVALLTGDEHNYCRTKICEEMPRYPETGYFAPKIVLHRAIYQINNGAAGAPYYSMEKTPWSNFTSSFTTQNALVFFHINGNEVKMEVLNPDTLELVDLLTLRE